MGIDPHVDGAIQTTDDAHFADPGDTFELRPHGFVAELRQRGVTLVCLAGFMRLLGPEFVAAYPNAILNIHPSLLPSYPGLNTHERALSGGVKVHGCTVHFVTGDLDGGPIIAQAAVPVLAEDSAESLAERVLAEEHRIYPMALDWVASGRAKLAEDKVFYNFEAERDYAPLLVPYPARR